MLNGEIKNYIAQIDAFKNIFKTNSFQSIVSTSQALEKMVQQIVPSNITEKLKESRSILDSFANSFEPVLEKLRDTELHLLRDIESTSTTSRKHLYNINPAYSTSKITQLFLLSTTKQGAIRLKNDSIAVNNKKIAESDRQIDRLIYQVHDLRLRR